MSIRVLTWNMHYGSCSSIPQCNGVTTSPLERLEFIAAFANNSNIDVVFLQEHPGGSSGAVDHHGQLPGANLSGYGYSVFPEMAGNINNPTSASNRAYAFLVKPGVVLGNLGYFNQQYFTLNQGLSYMRAPAAVDITANGSTYHFLHWHNETQNNAKSGFNILTSLLRQNLPQNTVVIGDLNITSNYIDQNNFYNQWDNVVNNSNAKLGVDQILTPLQTDEYIHLDFISDANHHPLLCKIG